MQKEMEMDIDDHEILRLLTLAQLLNAKDSRSFSDKLRSSQVVNLSQYLVEQGAVTNDEMDSILIAARLIRNQMISDAQFAVAIYDQRVNGINMLDSLKQRSWL